MKTATTKLLISALLAILCAAACQDGEGRKSTTSNDSIIWKSSAIQLASQIENCYNNDKNDSVYQLAPIAMELSREHGLWRYYYYTWSILAMTYIWDNQPDVAIREAQRMQEEALARNDNYGLSKAYVVLGDAYAAQDNLIETVQAYRNALDIQQSADGFSSKSTIYGKYCMTLKAMGKYEEIDSVLTGWKTEVARYPLEVNHDNASIIAHWHYEYLYWMATLCLHDGRYKDAETMADSASYYLDVSGRTVIHQSRHEGLCFEIAMCKGDYKEALASCNRKMALTPSGTSSNYRAALADRSTAYEKQGFYKEALADYRRYNSLNDSVRQEETRKQLNVLNKRFELNELKAENEREQMEARQQQLILYMAIASLLVIGLVVYIVLHRRAERRMAVLSAEKERMKSELRIAHDIQTKMVPSEFPHLGNLDMYASLAPAKEVGGDLFDYLLSDGILYFCLGDVSGKGVPAALLMTQAVKLFRAIAKQKVAPAEIAARINDELSENNEHGMFVTMFIGCLDMATSHLEFCNCGHNPPVIGELGSGCHFLQIIPNCPLGILTDMEFRGEAIESIKGQALFIYSDGLNEAENLQQEQFGDDRLLNILLTTHFDSAFQAIDAMRLAVEKHRNGAEPNDDLSMLCLIVK